MKHPIVRTTSSFFPRAGAAIGVWRRGLCALLSFHLLSFSVVGVNLTGCSSIDRRQIERQSALPTPETEARMSGPEEEDFADRIRRLPESPRTLAVHLFEPYDAYFNWTAADSGEIVGWKSALEHPELFDSMFVMSGVFSTGNSLAEIRYAAAQHGANTVLTINAGGDVSNGYNPLALFYITILGYFIFPGSSGSALFNANGVVLDVATGQVLARLSTQTTGFTIAPGFFYNPRSAIAEAKRDGIRKLKHQFVEQINRLPYTGNGAADSAAEPPVSRPRSPRRPAAQPRVLSY